MRPHTPIQRILLIRPLRPPNSLRPFTQNSIVLRSRPQLPFLSTSRRRPIARFLTTETKEWIKEEVTTGLRYSAAIYVIIASALSFGFGVHQLWMEHEYPTPAEWSWFSRYDYRFARWMEDENEVDWSMIGIKYIWVLSRLEDPNKDGAGLQESGDGGILVEGIGKTGLDVSNMSEHWRRAYYGVLMGCAKSAEYLDGWVHDTTRNRKMSWDIAIDPFNKKMWELPFPGDVVRGPSNPNPGPIKPGMQSPPKDKDCKPFFDTPEKFYMKILTTTGFTDRQKVDAALAYGLWLDYKGTPETAREMFNWALDIATSSADKPIVDRKTGVINHNAGITSDNVFAASTALAIHHAVNGNLSTALPIFVSVLRARKSIPDTPPTMLSTLAGEAKLTNFEKAIAAVKLAFRESTFPDDPGDGNAPPVRDAKELCEEAGIMTYIGEILFAANMDKTSLEDGLAWTREAVDIAEAELRKKSIQGEAKKTCKQCLETGLTNWMTMVLKMAMEEKGKQETKGTTGWLGFGTLQQDAVGRWESEENVIKERFRRANDLLETPGRSW